MFEDRLDEKLLLQALEEAQKAGADYAEVRGVAGVSTFTRVRNGEVSAMDTSRDRGWGLQIRIGDGWGFASSPVLSPESIKLLAAQASRIASASAKVQLGEETYRYGEPSTGKGEYHTPYKINPFAVPPAERLEMLMSAEANLRQASRVKSGMVTLQMFQTWKFFANTGGAYQQQFIVEGGGELAAVAVEGSGSYRRSLSNYGQGGYEYILDLKLEDEALRVGQEAHEIVVAESVPPGPRMAVIGSNIAALIVHESCGHPTESDRALGSENAFAGGSFLQPKMLGNFRYGSPEVSITADATISGGLGTMGWDDEGTPAQRVPLIENGIFKGYLTNRETGANLGLPNGGMGRASSWGRIPIVRMTNVNLEPGEGSLESLIAEVEDGLYLDTPASWSLDDKRMNFHFSTELCREIKNGRLGRLYRGGSFQSRTPVFWGNCLKVAGPEDWKLWGFLSCAKGEPLQSAHVSHGAAPLLVKDLYVRQEG